MNIRHLKVSVQHNENVAENLMPGQRTGTITHLKGQNSTFQDTWNLPLPLRHTTRQRNETNAVWNQYFRAKLLYTISLWTNIFWNQCSVDKQIWTNLEAICIQLYYKILSKWVANPYPGSGKSHRISLNFPGMTFPRTYTMIMEQRVHYEMLQ